MPQSSGGTAGEEPSLRQAGWRSRHSRCEGNIMFIWYSAMMLVFDSAKVVEMRLRMIALGQNTPTEMVLMVTEKLDAIKTANAIIGRGGDPSHIIDSYRRIVSANVARLSAR
jgi:hypothetical protein